jgi:hypothetical protein
MPVVQPAGSFALSADVRLARVPRADADEAPALAM